MAVSLKQVHNFFRSVENARPINETTGEYYPVTADVIRVWAGKLATNDEEYNAYLKAGGEYFNVSVPSAWYKETPAAATPTYTPEQQAEYQAYLDYIKANPILGLPVPKDIDDYYANRDKWIEEYTPTPTPEPTPEVRTYTDDEFREYNTYRRWASSQGTPDDWYPVDIDDYFNHWDIAQEQMDEWKGEASEAEKKRLEEEEKAAERQAKYEAEQAEAEKYALTPEEQARRREESYAYTQQQRAISEAYQKAALSPEEEARRREEQYAYSQWAQERARISAQEAYRETPEYQGSFYNYFEGLSSTPGRFQDFMLAMFPKLREEWEATQPKLTGYPTPQEARAEATRRETAFGQWLPTQTKKMMEQFYVQAPPERGERPAYFAPRLRSVNFG